jgi:hypothetical protein
MTMTWRTRPRETGTVPPAIAKIYCDTTIAGGPSGTGTMGDPYNYVRGSNAAHADVVGGVHVCVRGPFQNVRFARSGTAHRPIVLRGDEPGWGQGVIDGSAAVSMAPCATIGEAFGNPDWALLHRGTLTTDLAPADWRRLFYEDLDPMLLASFPAQVEATWEDKSLWSLETFANSIWPETSWVSDSWTRARSRIEIASHPGLAAALSAEAFPILLMHIFPNVISPVRLIRANSDGTPNPAGLFLVGEAPYLTSSQSFYGVGTRFLVLNLPTMLAAARPGQVAFNHTSVTPWVLASKRAAGGVVSRAADGASSNGGFQFGTANRHILMHGFKVGGFSTRNGVEIDGVHQRIQRCEFLGSSDMVDGGSLLLANGSHQIVQYNTFRKTWRQEQINGINNYSERRFNYFERPGGSAMGANGTVAVQMVYRGNHVFRANGGHGNALTIYANMHGCAVVDNSAEDCARPWTSERGPPTYDPGLPAPGIVLARNWFQRSGLDSAAWACRFQSGVVEGLVMQENRIDSGTVNANGFITFAGGNQNGTFTANTVLGGISNLAAGAFTDPPNTIAAHTGPAADATRVAWAADPPHLRVSPGGVGHLGGY